jgi:hypothetical protein
MLLLRENGLSFVGNNCLSRDGDDKNTRPCFKRALNDFLPGRPATAKEVQRYKHRKFENVNLTGRRQDVCICHKGAVLVSCRCSGYLFDTGYGKPGKIRINRNLV